MDSSITSSSHRIKGTARQRRPEMQEPQMVPGVPVCGSIRHMDSSIRSSSSHSMKDTAGQRRPVQMGVSVCLHVAASVVWTVVSVVAAIVSRTPRGSTARTERKGRILLRRSN